MLSGWLKLEKEVGGPLFSSTEAEWLKPIQRIAHRVARFLFSFISATSHTKQLINKTIATLIQ
jgi:hypothetical protein